MLVDDGGVTKIDSVVIPSAHKARAPDLLEIIRSSITHFL